MCGGKIKGKNFMKNKDGYENGDGSEQDETGNALKKTQVNLHQISMKNIDSNMSQIQTQTQTHTTIRIPALTMKKMKINRSLMIILAMISQ